ncbi:MAG TPA: PIG-L family deacetylase [Phycisphaerae bacterium]|nr:PIG-L family deacetylase [Phycisphaerae bacterium]
MVDQLLPLLVFGAHPDDVEFGAGGIVYKEARAGRRVHVVVASRGESGTHGTAEQREAEARAAAKILGATVEFVELDGDGRLEVRAAHAVALARVIRRERPGIVMGPTGVENQHPDHAALSALVRTASRLARFGGMADLREQGAHAIGGLLWYAVTADAELGAGPVLVDVSAAEVMEAWRAAMEAHGSQMGTRKYVEMALARARLWGLRAGVEHALPVWANDGVVVGGLGGVGRGARGF